MKRCVFACVGIVVCVFMAVQAASAATATNRYVVKGNVGAAPPYDTLGNAAADIQTAINAAVAANGDQVLVAAGTYDTGGTKVNYTTNRVYINKAITVRSIDNDPTTTIIKGAWHPGTTNGWLAVRCVYMVDNSKLIGFTLTNGATLSSNEVAAVTLLRDASGGGIRTSTSAGTGVAVSNCIITGNSAFGDRYNGSGGGGVNGGTYFNCQFIGNSTPQRGGAAAGEWSVVLSNCVVVGNTAGDTGGGAQAATLYGCIVSNNRALYGGGVFGRYSVLPCYAYDCTFVGNAATERGGAAYNDYNANMLGVQLFNCVVSNNTAKMGGGVYFGKTINCTVTRNAATGNNNGGGLYGCMATNCTITYNTALSGGGAIYGTLYNCLLYGNYVSWAGGGAFNSSLYSCTVVGNSAASWGGGVMRYDVGTNNVVNCVVYSNECANGPNWYSSVGQLRFTNTCTSPEQVGWAVGNITNEPRLIACGASYGTNHIAGNYRLSSRSPCINAGLYETWMDAWPDLDGNKRVDPGSLLVDMGCYEYVFPPGTLIQMR